MRGPRVPSLISCLPPSGRDLRRSTMSRRTRVAWLLLVAMAPGIVLRASPGWAQGPIKIGASLSLTGTYAAPAQP